MRNILIILLINTVWVYSQTALDDYDFNQHAITYDTASAGMHVGIYHPPYWIYYCDTTTGTWTYTIEAGNDDGYFANTDSLITINSTPTAGTYYLLCKVANSTGWNLQDTLEITVYDADECAFGFRSANNWHEDTVYFLERGQTYGYMNVNVNDDLARIGAWGQGVRPVVDSLLIIQADSVNIYSIESNYGIVIYPDTYRDSLYDCESNNRMIGEGNASVYVKSPTSDFDNNNHYFENCVATTPDVYHAFKISGRGTVIKNCIGNNSTDGHGFSLTDLCDIRYSYAYSNNSAGVEAAGDSTYIESCTFDENLYGVQVQDGTGHASDTTYRDTIKYCYISQCYDSTYSAIEIIGAQYTVILNNYLDSNHIDSWIYNQGDTLPSRNITYRGNYFTGAVVEGIHIDNDSDTILLYYNIHDSISQDAINIESGADYIRIYNCTLFKDSITTAGSNIEVKNSIYENLTGSATTSNNLVTDTDTIYVDQSSRNYRLSSNATNAINQGTDVGLTGVDFYNLSIPQNGTFDIGAAEYDAGATSGTFYYRINGQNYYMKLEDNDYTIELP